MQAATYNRVHTVYVKVTRFSSFTTFATAWYCIIQVCKNRCKSCGTLWI